MSLPVYLVEDDDAVREGLALLLRTVGLDVRSFAGPSEFLSALDRLQPGCLILDIRMPHLSGLKLQEKLSERGVDWPTVVISGHGDIEACRRAFRNGAIDFLSKPVDEQDLIDAIQGPDPPPDRRRAGAVAPHRGQPPRRHRGQGRDEFGGGADPALDRGARGSVELPIRTQGLRIPKSGVCP